MLTTLMIGCAIAAVILIVAGAFSEFRDLWKHPDHRAIGGGSEFTDNPKHTDHRHHAI